jgi:hypothetical protein
MSEEIVKAEEKVVKKKRERPPANWCVILEAGELFVIGGYRPLAVELLKQVAPGGARKFYRSPGLDFFSQFPLKPAQMVWLQEAGYFNGVWEVLHEYRRKLLTALSAEYPEVWLVANGKARLHQLPPGAVQSDTEKYAFGPHIIMPLTWARSYALYCHRHRAWEIEACKEAGVITERPVSQVEQAGESLKKAARRKKWPDLELHAPKNTLVRARRKQTSYYLAAENEPVRLGRDAEGESVSRQVIEAQRLAILLRAAQAMTLGAPLVPFA